MLARKESVMITRKNTELFFEGCLILVGLTGIFGDTMVYFFVLVAASCYWAINIEETRRFLSKDIIDNSRLVFPFVAGGLCYSIIFLVASRMNINKEYGSQVIFPFFLLASLYMIAQTVCVTWKAIKAWRSSKQT